VTVSGGIFDDSEQYNNEPKSKPESPKSEEQILRENKITDEKYKEDQKDEIKFKNVLILFKKKEEEKEEERDSKMIELLQKVPGIETLSGFKSHKTNYVRNIEQANYDKILNFIEQNKEEIKEMYIPEKLEEFKKRFAEKKT
jgi:hypothetical protein